MTIFITRRTLLALGGAALVSSFAGCRRREPLTFNGTDITGSFPAKDLKLPDAEGKERSLSDFTGKVAMVFFGFTQCPDVCPTALSRAVEVKRLLGTDGDRLQVVFVTVDPERDTPEVLKAYAAAFDPSFVALRGNDERLAQAAKDFKIFYKKVPTGDSYSMDHTALSYLFDPSGNLRLAMSHSLGAPAYADDVRKLLRSA